MGVDSMLRQCAECGGERTFEQPQCEDGHGDCPDWGCVECGMAIRVAGSVEWLDVPLTPAGAAAGSSTPLRATA